MKRILIIRADADAQRGTGHVMRCMALAQEWLRRGGRVVFITQGQSEKILQRLRNEGCEVLSVGRAHPSLDDLDFVLSYIGRIRNQSHRDVCIVLDGYHFDVEYQRAVHHLGYKLLVIDDIAHHPEYSADFILNQNILAETYSYRCNKETVLLLGSTYCLIREEFLNRQELAGVEPASVKNILVTLGGSDTRNLNVMITTALNAMNDRTLNVTYIAGPTFHDYANLKEALRNVVFENRLIRATEDMSLFMNKHDLAISTAGSTCWEMCFMGLPFVTIIAAENQADIAHTLDKKNIAPCIGWYNDISPDDIIKTLERVIYDDQLRRNMSERGRYLIDGSGASRVVETISRS